MNEEGGMESVSPRLFGAPEGALLTPKQVAENLSVSVKTLERWRMTGEGPRFCRLSPKVIRYLSGDIDAFVKSRAKRNTASL
jgi:predicted DNA-binding transcriptional regulator AlpA